MCTSAFQETFKTLGNYLPINFMLDKILSVKCISESQEILKTWGYLNSFCKTCGDITTDCVLFFSPKVLPVISFCKTFLYCDSYF